ncbi:MAG: hypothetical protein M3Y22_01235, partial [Pseudomonadota bacterium]|nr:hypothetical protein [Pseudomonadota bacterium]
CRFPPPPRKPLTDHQHNDGTLRWNESYRSLTPLRSIAIFLGFLAGTFGLACCIAIAVAFWLSKRDPHDDPMLHYRWVRPALAATMFPVPLLLAFGGGAALWWGFFG